MKKIIRWCVGILLGMYLCIVLLLNIPMVQQQVASWASGELSRLLGSELTLERVNLGLLNRVIIDNLLLKDLQGEELAKVTRLSAKFELSGLLRGKIAISNAQLFGFHIHLNKPTPDAPPNFQFVMDALASKDTIPKESALDLRINSLLIRRGRVAYDVLSEPATPGRFNPNHLYVHNLIATLSLKALQKDSVNAFVKRLSLEEAHSGFALKKITMKLVANNKQMRIENFGIEMPHSSLSVDTLRMDYDSVGSLSRLAPDVHFRFKMRSSKVTLCDLAPFVPALSPFREPLHLTMEAGGTPARMECANLLIEGCDRHFQLRGDVAVQDLHNPQHMHFYGRLSRLFADPQGTTFLWHNLTAPHQALPRPLQQMGTISFQGEVSGYFTDLVMYGKVKTDVGSVQTDLRLSMDKEKQTFAYAGMMKTDQFQLGQLLDEKKLGSVTFNLNVDGHHTPQSAYPTVMLKGEVAHIDYNGYPYENILLDGTYRQGGYEGKLAIDDPNGALTLNGSFNTASQVPVFNFLADVRHVRLHDLKLSEKYQDTDLSLKLRADFTGGTVDEMNGEINIDSLCYESPDTHYFLPNLKLSSTTQNKRQKRLHLTSPFMTASIEGDYTYHTLPASLSGILRHYLPSLLPPEKRQHKNAENNFSFDVHLYDAELFAALFQLPLKVYTHSTLKGYVNEKAQKLRVEGYFPKLRYKEKFIESAMLFCENPDDRFRAAVRFNQRKQEESMSVSMEAVALNDSVQAHLNWGNDRAVTYGGKLSATACFEQQEAHGKPKLRTVVDIHPTDIILSDTLWNIHPATVVLDEGKIHIRHFGFSHQDRHLHIHGTLSKEPQDTVYLDLQQINIGYVFDIADLGVNFQGEATGPARASGVLDTPVMSTDLQVRNLGINNAVLGDAAIHGEWHHHVKGILLDARIREKELARTHVHGFIYPIKPTSSLDLQIEADHTSLNFIHYYMTGITPDFHGRVTGNVHLYGKFKALTMEGQVDADASMKIAVLNTSFQVKDSILIEPGGLTFRNNRVFDPQGHEGRMDGYLHYNHFKDLSYLFRFQLQNMLVMNTRESRDNAFYGTVYGTGSATLQGNAQDGVNIDLALSTNRNTTFTYIKDNVSAATSNQFIKFVDRTPRRAVLDSIPLDEYEQARRKAREEEEESDTDIHLNLQVDATPDATMRIIMDPVAGDYISGRGSGNIRADFYNKGDFRMFGNYTIRQGVYKFSLQEVIRKDFSILDGSSIAFSGDPAEAVLDMKACYTVNSASLNDLLPSSATATDYISQTNVKVNCLMNLTGQLTAPSIQMELELPNERDEIQALVRNYIPTDEQMNMQILYLLSIGKFYTPEYVDVQQNSNMMSSMLSSTLSGQLNNALSHIIDNNNWNIGTNLSTGQKGWTDVEFEGILSGQLLNNRLLINGNFGYRENPMANTNFVGDFEAEWLVNRSGEIRLKAYNETNDRYYTRTNLTTQGIGIIFRKDFDHWNELLFWNKWRLKRLQRRMNTSQPTDTIRSHAASKRDRP